MQATFEDFNIQIPPGRHGDVKVLCPECSKDRRKRREPCLSVNIEEGVWNCHNCGWKGSLKRNDLGLRGVFAKPAKVYRKPEPPPPESALTLLARQFFAAREIPDTVAEAFGIFSTTHYSREHGKEIPAIAFPYYRDGELVNIKYRMAGKEFSNTLESRRSFYNRDACTNAKTVIIVEGECDALAIHHAGLPYVMSVPNGAKSLTEEVMEDGAPIFAQAERIILAVDMDEDGRALEDKLIKQLPKEKLLRVRWPDGCKDANDVLKRDGTEGVFTALADARPIPLPEMPRPLDLYEEIFRAYDGEYPEGFSTGWPTLDKYYRPALGYFTVVTGIPGHGKSAMLNALMVNLAQRYGWHFAIFSPEMYPQREMFIRLMQLHRRMPFRDGPNPRILREQLADEIYWLHDYFGLIDPEEPTLESILEQAGRYVQLSGTSGIVIDPWNEIDHTRAPGMNETEHISQSLSKIRRFARENNVHVWLVAHPRILIKDHGQKEYPVPTAYQISGSAHWRNKADNILCVYRPLPPEDDLISAPPPVQIHIQKVRMQPQHGMLGVVEFAFSTLTGNYADILAGGFATAEGRGEAA